MIKAVLLILSPVATWERIADARRGLLAVLTVYLLPLLVLTSVGEGYGLVRWGEEQGRFGLLHRFSVGEVVIFEAAQLLLSVLVVLIGATLLKLLAETFRGRHPFSQTFAVIAYSLSPLFLLRLADAFPHLSPWVSWSIGILLSIKVFYSALPQMLDLDPSHMFGLFVSSGLVLIVTTGLLRLTTIVFLQGKFEGLQAAVSALAARLPF